MSEHTKGPWAVAETRHGYDTVIRCPKGAPIGLALLGGYSKKEGGANSKLIAAAPELLHALEAIVSDLPISHDWLDPQIERFAKDAIAKATGSE